MARPPNPQVVPVVDRERLVTREWLRYLEQLAGAATAADLSALLDDVATLQAEVDALQATTGTDTSGLQAQIDALQLLIDALTARVDAIEADTGLALVLYDDEGKALMDSNGLELTD